MSGGDGVSSLNDLNEKYKQWVKNRKIEGGTTGTCNADSLYTSSSVIDGTDTKRVKDYYLCGDKDYYNCKGLDWEQWNSIWGNCQKNNSGNRYDKCDNMATNSTPGANPDGDQFEFDWDSGDDGKYNPVTDSLEGNAECAWGHDCNIGEVNGQRPAYPNNKTDVNNIMSNEGDNNQDAYYIDGLEGCPERMGRQLICALDGRDNTWTGDEAPGCGFSSDEGPNNLGKFCARSSSDYDDSNIANCCLGSLAGGPEVDTEGNPLSTDYKSCPREFCVSRIAEGTESGSAGVNCDDPKTDKNASNVDETFCYKMSNECNTFFAEKCQDAFSDDYSGNLKQQCKDWAHIQPQEFVRIAEDVCNINSPTNDYVDERARPTANDLRHVKSVLNRPLCREYITSTEH